MIGQKLCEKSKSDAIMYVQYLRLGLAIVLFCASTMVAIVPSSHETMASHCPGKKWHNTSTSLRYLHYKRVIALHVPSFWQVELSAGINIVSVI